MCENHEPLVTLVRISCRFQIQFTVTRHLFNDRIIDRVVHCQEPVLKIWRVFLACSAQEMYMDFLGYISQHVALQTNQKLPTMHKVPELFTIFLWLLFLFLDLLFLTRFIALTFHHVIHLSYHLGITIYQIFVGWSCIE